MKIASLTNSTLILLFSILLGVTVPVSATAQSSQESFGGWKSFMDCDNLLTKAKFQGTLDKGMHVWEVNFKNSYMWEVRFSWGLGPKGSTKPIVWYRHSIPSGDIFSGSEHLPSKDGPIKIFIKDVLVFVPSDKPEDPRLFRIDYCPGPGGYPHISERNTYPAKKKSDSESTQTKIAKTYEKLCANGDATSCLVIAKAYEDGNLGLSRNPEMAQKYSEQACQLNSSVCEAPSRTQQQQAKKTTSRTSVSCPEFSDEFWGRLWESQGGETLSGLEPCTANFRVDGDHIVINVSSPKSGCALIWAKYCYFNNQNLNSCDDDLLVMPINQHGDPKKLHKPSWTHPHRGEYQLRSIGFSADRYVTRKTITGMNPDFWNNNPDGVCLVLPRSFHK